MLFVASVVQFGDDLVDVALQRSTRRASPSLRGHDAIEPNGTPSSVGAFERFEKKTVDDGMVPRSRSTFERLTTSSASEARTTDDRSATTATRGDCDADGASRVRSTRNQHAASSDGSIDTIVAARRMAYPKQTLESPTGISASLR
jgi:hypothetical protein